MPIPKPLQKQTPPSTNAFSPVMKRRHLDALVRMAEQSGRSPQDLYEELLDAATDATPPPNGGRAKASPAPTAPPPTPTATGNVPAAVTAPRPDGHRVAKVTVVQPPAGPPMGESVAAQRRREAGETEEEASTSDDEGSSGDAPPGQMKGSKPNPLRTPTARDWAGRKDDDEKSGFPPPKKTTEDDERERRRKKYLNPTKAQTRG